MEQAEFNGLLLAALDDPKVQEALCAALSDKVHAASASYIMDPMPDDPVEARLAHLVSLSARIAEIDAADAEAGIVPAVLVK